MCIYIHTCIEHRCLHIHSHARAHIHTLTHISAKSCETHDLDHMSSSVQTVPLILDSLSVGLSSYRKARKVRHHNYACDVSRMSPVTHHEQKMTCTIRTMRVMCYCLSTV